MSARWVLWWIAVLFYAVCCLARDPEAMHISGTFVIFVTMYIAFRYVVRGIHRLLTR